MTVFLYIWEVRSLSLCDSRPHSKLEQDAEGDPKGRVPGDMRKGEDLTVSQPPPGEKEKTFF
jgi:hypothetical protein